MLELRPTELDGVIEVRPPRFGDERGFFSETWSAAAFAAAGLPAFDFVQDNHSHSAAAGTLRGLHFQVPPFEQDKLIRVTRGAVFDIAVDVRRGSPSFGKWAGGVLSAQEWNQLLIPKGFAHGFLTLEPDTEVQYKVTARYSPEHERTVAFDDPALAIDWPGERSSYTLNARDAAAPALSEVETGFAWP